MYYKECHLSWVLPGEGGEHDYSNKQLIRLEPIAILNATYVNSLFLLKNWRSFEGYTDILSVS